MKRLVLCSLILILIFAAACGPAKKWDTGKMGGISAPTGTLDSVTRIEGGYKYIYSDMLYDDAVEFLDRISTSAYALNISSGVEDNSLFYYGESPNGDVYGVVYSIDDKTCTITHKNSGGSNEG